VKAQGIITGFGKIGKNTQRHPKNLEEGITGFRKFQNETRAAEQFGVIKKSTLPPN